ncbi:phosphoethanolamine transferase [Photobacterium damselae subsp. damselae]|uniref:phosphoethanolamine transferase n=1 Tax=Photobacterium damselae TaxID=38293 RepID=UPI00311AC299
MGESTLNDKSKYNTYVLVIGESVRRDYMGVYGYPINNTPFLSKVNGVVINGLESAGTNTVASLRLMLTQGNINKWTPEYNYNIIDLAKSAGYKTYWLSNQGYTGTYDTPVTAIAKQSDNRYFLKLGAYNSSNTSDYALLPEIKTTISNKIKKKLIVIHLYGSHPSACDRITDFDKIITVKDKKYKYLSCYVNSIAKTDDFLSQVYSMLEDEYQKNKNDTFSMIYFSDHGLSHRLVDGQILFNNNKVSKYHFDVPLIKMSSDDYQHDEYNVSKSGAFFTDGLASWLGINNEKISNRYDLFSNESDKEISHYRVKLDEYKNDPAINIDNL